MSLYKIHVGEFTGWKIVAFFFSSIFFYNLHYQHQLQTIPLANPPYKSSWHYKHPILSTENTDAKNLLVFYTDHF